MPTDHVRVWITHLGRQNRARASDMYHVTVDRRHLWETIRIRFEWLHDLLRNFIGPDNDHRRSKRSKVKKHEGWPAKSLVYSSKC